MKILEKPIVVLILICLGAYLLINPSTSHQALDVLKAVLVAYFAGKGSSASS